MADNTLQNMNEFVLDDDLFNSFQFSTLDQTGFEDDLGFFSESSSCLQTVPSVSPASSPPCTPPESQDLYPNETLFEGISDVCHFSAPPVKQEFQSNTANLTTKPKVKSNTNNGNILGKKRSRKAIGSNDSPPCKTKPDFCNMTSKSLEEYAKQLEATGNLTMEEERQLKKQRRLIKNRESAQLSRLRKKQYIVDLEQKVRFMSNESEQLKKQVADLTGRNIELENQVAQLKSIVNSMPLKNPKAAIGLCMVVFLFSLGLFLNAPNHAQTIPQLSHHPQSVYTGRVLQEVPLETVDTDIQLLEKRKSRDFVNDDIVSPKRRSKVEVLEDYDEEFELLSSHTSSIPEIKDHYSLTVVDNPTNPLNPEIKSNDSSYIYCSEAHQLAVPSSQSISEEAPTITVLLPSAVLNGTIPHMEYFIDDPENSLLEVSCQILNITVYPFYNRVNGNNFPLIGST